MKSAAQYNSSCKKSRVNYYSIIRAVKKEISASKIMFFVDKILWKMWITIYFRRFSPIFTTSPAPIVINKSPFWQFSIQKSSISRKVG